MKPTSPAKRETPSPSGAPSPAEKVEPVSGVAPSAEQNPFPVLRVDSKGSLLYANPAAEPLLREWKIKTGDPAPPCLRSAAREALTEGLSKSLRFEILQRTFSFDVTPVREAGYAHLYGHDRARRNSSPAQKTKANVRKIAEQAAIDTVNALGEGIVLCDLDGRIRNANHAFSVLTGYEKPELIGQNIKTLLPDIFDEEDRTVYKTIVRVRLKNAMNSPADALTISTRTGARKWVIPTLTTLHGPEHRGVAILLALRDISALMNTQAELREKAQRYRDLVENANSIIVRIAPDSRITFFNEYAQNFFGYSADEILDKNIIGTILPEIDSQGHDLNDLVQNLIFHPETLGNYDSEARRKNGKPAWIHWSNRALRDTRGRVKEILCVGTDITARKHLEREADAYRRRLRALAGQLAVTEEQERRQVATQIHDTVIQTLSLSAIRLAGVQAALKKAGMVDQRKRVEGIRQLLDQGTKECRGLMRDLVPSLLYEVGLPAALKDFAQHQSQLDGTPIRVEKDETFPALDDALRSLLFQCARDLVMNALKHAGPCEIRITLSSADAEKEVRLQVQDTGKGFNPAEREREKHNEEPGGFGLFNLAERLDCLGGQLDIDSAPGKGTKATVHVPVNQ